jgi:WD40 repeat protein
MFAAASGVQVYLWASSNPTVVASNFTTAHTQAIAAIASDYKGTIVTCSYDTTCIRYNTLGQSNLTFTSHSSPLRTVLVTWDGTKVISGSADGTVFVWALSTGIIVTQFNSTLLGTTLNTMTQLSGMLLVTGDTGGNFKIWNFWSGSLVTNFSLPTSIQINWIQMYEADTVYYGDQSGNVGKYRWTTGVQIYSQPICSGSTSVKSVFAVLNGSILVQCGNLTVVYLDPTLTQMLDQYAPTYAQFSILPTQYPLFCCKIFSLKC